MLGYVTLEGAGAADALLADVAGRLMVRGWSLAGAVQDNPPGGRDGRCHMELRVLAARRVIRISQDLGALSRGCRLDPNGLETAVGLAEAALDGSRPRLVIVNKFGKQEIDGRGFRPLIGRALSMEIPVLTSVGPGQMDGFLAFAEDFAEPVEPQAEAILAWAESAADAAPA